MWAGRSGLPARNPELPQQLRGFAQRQADHDRVTAFELADEHRRQPLNTITAGLVAGLTSRPVGLGLARTQRAEAHTAGHHPRLDALRAGQRIASYAKQQLPNYQLFDEQRYFAPGSDSCVIEVQGVRVGLIICEDSWFDAPAQQAVAAGAELIAVLNASPYHMGKSRDREKRIASLAALVQRPVFYAHMVGGQDEAVFDGGSFAVQADGSLAGRAASFAEDNWLVQLQQQGDRLNLAASTAATFERDGQIGLPPYQYGYSSAEVWQALVMGTRDYVLKSGFSDVLIGLSGGMDSALVLAIAVDALGADHVRTVMMPSPYTADISLIDARDMAERVGVRYDELLIQDTFEQFRSTLAPLFEGRAEDTTEENIQARVRGTLLMALSNKFGSLVLTTGNKSELSTGYCTLYGDMAGGLAPISDLPKMRVYELSRHLNRRAGRELIPASTLEKAPSAELRPDQTDQDSLPPYELLDRILEGLVAGNLPPAKVARATGAPEALVAGLARQIDRAEYKRQQAAPGLKVSTKAFGSGRRIPIAQVPGT